MLPPDQPRHPHDAGYKLLFSHPEFVRDLITGFVDDDWLAELDYGTLEQVPGHYVTEDFQHRSEDMVWRVKVGGTWVYLYLLIEFQSTVDRHMALRMMVYTGLLYQQLLKQDDLLEGGLLPPVLPIVLYNGSPRWTAVKDIAELIPQAPGIVGQFRPSVKYLVIDEGAYSDEELASKRNLVAAIFRFEQPVSREAIVNAIDALNLWLNDEPQLRHDVNQWLRLTFSRPGHYTFDLPPVGTLKELSMTLSERIKEWSANDVAKGRQEGRQEGLQVGLERGQEEGARQGAARALLALLTKRFGPPSAALQTRIHTATHVQIEAWFDRALEADSLAQVF